MLMLEAGELRGAVPSLNVVRESGHQAIVCSAERQIIKMKWLRETKPQTAAFFFVKRHRITFQLENP